MTDQQEIKSLTVQMWSDYFTISRFLFKYHRPGGVGGTGWERKRLIECLSIAMVKNEINTIDKVRVFIKEEHGNYSLTKKRLFAMWRKLEEPPFYHFVRSYAK